MILFQCLGRRMLIPACWSSELDGELYRCLGFELSADGYLFDCTFFFGDVFIQTCDLTNDYLFRWSSPLQENFMVHDFCRKVTKILWFERINQQEFCPYSYFYYIHRPFQKGLTAEGGLNEVVRVGGRGKQKNTWTIQVLHLRWALRDSNPRPSARKADALNQLS